MRRRPPSKSRCNRRVLLIGCGRRADWNISWIIKTLLGRGDAWRERQPEWMFVHSVPDDRFTANRWEAGERWQGTVHHCVHLCTCGTPNCPFRDSTSSSANPRLDAQQLDGWREKTGCFINRDASKSASTLTGWMNYKSLRGVMCLLPHHFCSTFIFSETNLQCNIRLTLFLVARGSRRPSHNLATPLNPGLRKDIVHAWMRWLSGKASSISHT